MSDVTITERETLSGFIIDDQKDFSVAFVYDSNVGTESSPAPVFHIPRKKLANGEVQELDSPSVEIHADMGNGKGPLVRRWGTPCLAHVDKAFLDMIRKS